MNMINKLKNIFSKKEKKEQRPTLDLAEIEKQINEKQAIVTAEYERDGPTESVIKKQVEVNTMRRKYNISDKTKMTESNKGFVQ